MPPPANLSACSLVTPFPTTGLQDNALATAWREKEEGQEPLHVLAGGWHAQEDEAAPELRRELGNFRRFCTQRSWQQQHEPISGVTADKYLDHLK